MKVTVGPWLKWPCGRKCTGWNDFCWPCLIRKWTFTWGKTLGFANYRKTGHVYCFVSLNVWQSFRASLLSPGQRWRLWKEIIHSHWAVTLLNMSSVADGLFSWWSCLISYSELAIEICGCFLSFCHINCVFVVQISAASHAPVHAFPFCFLNLSNDTEISRRQYVHKIVTGVRCYITQCCKMELLA